MLTKRLLERIKFMDMPPLTPPNKPLNRLFWRLLLVSACVLVFSFALHAKVAVYGHTTQPTPSTASKLWLSTSRVDSPPLCFDLFPFWVVALLGCLFSWQASGRYHELREAAVPELRGQRYFRRFLRPPPPR